jgi:PadR family transcriptional regulator, regulatory protein AphA
MAAHDDLSPTGYVVLGMLRLGVRTGYDIKQPVDKSTRFFWAASYGQIYPELKKLEEAGLIKGASDPQGGRRRRAYDLTAKGERALDAWLRSPDTPPVETRDSALLKLFFADGMGPEDAAAIARTAGERHAEVVRTLEQLDPPAGMTRTVRDFGLDFHRWCAERFAQMEKDLKEH